MGKGRSSGLPRTGGGGAGGGGQGAGGQANTPPAWSPQNPAPNGFTGTVSGGDISGTWTPPISKARGAEIESVMDAQGFRGRPRVVDQAEFDNAVKAAWGGNGLEVVRGIGAYDAQTLKDYKESMTDGDWYVSCGGGAAHGFGQYGAYRYGGKVSQKDINEAQLYADANSGYSGNTHIFHYTLDPSAKIGEESQLRSDMRAHNANARQTRSQAIQKRNQALAPVVNQLGSGTRAEQAAAKAWQRGNQDAKPRKNTTAKYQKEFNAAMDKLRKTRDSVSVPAVFNDVGVYAAAKGYDFYYDRRTGYSVTLNRTKMIVLDN